MTRWWSQGRDRIDVHCNVDIEQTPDSLHAHAIPEGVDIRPGDVVVVHGAPSGVRFGESVSLRCPATVLRANWFGRHWARLTGLLALTELYEVGFEPRH